MDEVALKKIFQHFDDDGSGSIDVEELRQAMMALGIKVTMSSCKKILAQIDTDGSGTIEWDEFLRGQSQLNSPFTGLSVICQGRRRDLLPVEREDYLSTAREGRGGAGGGDVLTMWSGGY